MTVPALSALRVLAIEYDAAEARHLRGLLANFGCEDVEHAYTGGGAILLADQLRPDLVIMDVDLSLPGEGLRAAAEIRARFGIPTLFLSRRDDHDLRRSALAAGMAGWLAKPYAVGELQVLLASAVAHLRRGTKVMFRQAHDHQTWHWCENCSTWPAGDYVERDGLPDGGELCSECCVKATSGGCGS
jgi:DNA-binding response OmpR family regulator